MANSSYSVEKTVHASGRRADVGGAARRHPEAAYQYGEEDTEGLPREGKRADLVIRSAVPLASVSEDQRDIEVLATIKNGEIVYEA